jgi:hypothetical protein
VQAAFWLPAASFFLPAFFYVLGPNFLREKGFDRDWYEEKKQRAQRKALKNSSKPAKDGKGTAAGEAAGMAPMKSDGS